MPITMPRNAYLYMDACRTIAACLVVVSHCRDLMMTDYAPGMGVFAKAFYFGTGFGHAGVIIFFVLSGFWISRSVVRRGNSGAFWKPYTIDRLSRLWVVLLPALIIGGILDTIGLHIDPFAYSGASGSASVPLDLSGRLTPSIFIGNMLFLQTLSVPTFGSNAPLWSLAYEFWFYVWFPALWLALRWLRFSVALFGLIAAVLFPQLVAGFACWLIGAVAYALVEGKPAAAFRLKRIGARRMLFSGIIFTLLMLAIVRVVHTTPLIDPTPFLHLLLAIAFGWTLVGLCLLDPRPLPGIKTLATYGANSSFSLYAIHFPIAMLAVTLLSSGRRMANSPTAILLVLALTGFLIFLGFLFSRMTEAKTPAIRGRLLVNRRKNPTSC